MNETQLVNSQSITVKSTSFAGRDHASKEVEECDEEGQERERRDSKEIWDNKSQRYVLQTFHSRFQRLKASSSEEVQLHSEL